MENSASLTYRIRRIPANVSGLTVARFLCDVLPGLAVDHVDIRSLAPTPDDQSRRPSQTATAQFLKTPVQLAHGADRNEWTVKVPGQPLPLVVDTHFLGFTPLNHVHHGNHEFDLVALSGLASHPFGSWKKHNSDKTSDGSSSAFMWLRDQLPHDFPNLRIMTYGYDTKLLNSQSFQTIEDLSRFLIAKLKSIGKAQTFTKPIIFFAHSLGGLILKRALCIMANSGESDTFMLEKVRIVIFFGVPSKGMNISYLQAMVDGQPNQHLIECLSNDTKNCYLPELDEAFSGISLYRQIRLISVYETKQSRTAQELSPGKWARVGEPVILVTRDSAIQRGSRDPQDVLSIDRNHSDIVKLSEDDTPYEVIKEHVRTTMENSIAITKLVDSKALLVSGSEQDSSTNTTNADHLAARKQALNSIKFVEMNFRSDQISEAHDESFKWLFDRSTGFQAWLENPNGLYWIRGKPGSGKSTLMKYLQKIFTAESTRAKLRLPKESHDIWYFFHERGSYLQKSFEGLMRTILYQLGSTVPLVSELIADYYTSKRPELRDIWTDRDLLELFEKIKTQQRKKIEIILFLDALDEFNGFPEVMAEFLGTVADASSTPSLTHIRICFSSRPWDAFVRRFGNCDGFLLQDMTRNDIISYAYARLARIRTLGADCDNLSIEGKRSKDPNPCSDIATSITERSEGVFLWVTLVIDELEKLEDQSLEHMTAELASFPTGLEVYYDWTIDRIPPQNQWEAFIILEMVFRSHKVITARELFLAYHCGQGESFDDCQRRLNAVQFDTDTVTDAEIGLRLKDLCGGLLELVNVQIETTDPYNYCYSPFVKKRLFTNSPKDLQVLCVQFIHKTAKDYVGRGLQKQLLRYQLAHQPENGNLFWMRYIFACYNETILPLGTIKDLLKMSHLAEYTTGRDSAKFLETVPASFFAVSPEKYPFNSLLSFAVVAGLQLYVPKALDHLAKVFSQSIASVVNSNPEVPLLHQMCRRYESDRYWDYTSQIPKLEAMARLLIACGADVHAKYAGNTALQYLFSFCLDIGETFYSSRNAEDGSITAIAQTLLQAGSDPNIELANQIIHSVDEERNWEYPTFCRPLHVCRGIMMTKLLIKHGADPNALDSHGNTPLHICIGSIQPVQAEYTEEPVKATFLIDCGGCLSRAGLRFYNKVLREIKYFSFQNKNDFEMFLCLIGTAAVLDHEPTKRELLALYPSLQVPSSSILTQETLHQPSTSNQQKQNVARQSLKRVSKRQSLKRVSERQSLKRVSERQSLKRVSKRQKR